MRVELDAQEIELLLRVLDSVPVRSIASMQACLSVAHKLSEILKTQEEPNYAKRNETTPT